MRAIGKLVIGVIFLSSPAVVSANGTHKHISGDGHHEMPMHEHWTVPEDAASRKNPVPENAASIARGRKVFEANCAICHGPDGDGDGPAGAALNPRPTNLRAMAGRHQDGDFAWKIANGRGPMPAWKATLSETQIWEVVNYIQSLARAAKNSDTEHGSHGGHKH